MHVAVVEHRQWFLRTVTELLAATGESDPEPAARHFVMLRGGAMAAGHLTDPAPVCDTFLPGVEGLLTYRDSPGRELIRLTARCGPVRARARVGALPRNAPEAPRCQGSP